MNQQEQQLWNYIDGLCSATERADIEKKLASDQSFQQHYRQLLELNQLLGNLDIDEPSMSFTRNVMTQVQQEIAPIKLKTKVDKRIIYTIGGFFSLTLLSLLGYTFGTANFKVTMPKINIDVDINALTSPTVLMVFLLINIALLLIYLDAFLRKGMEKTQKK